MFHNDSGTDVPETEASISGYFQIRPCPLFADIVGGTGKAMGRNGKYKHKPSLEIVIGNHL